VPRHPEHADRAIAAMNSARPIARERISPSGVGALVAWSHPVPAGKRHWACSLGRGDRCSLNCRVDHFEACWPAHRQTLVGRPSLDISSRINSTRGDGLIQVNAVLPSPWLILHKGARGRAQASSHQPERSAA